MRNFFNGLINAVIVAAAAAVGIFGVACLFFLGTWYIWVALFIAVKVWG